MSMEQLSTPDSGINKIIPSNEKEEEIEVNTEGAEGQILLEKNLLALFYKNDQEGLTEVEELELKKLKQAYKDSKQVETIQGEEMLEQ